MRVVQAPVHPFAAHYSGFANSRHLTSLALNGLRIFLLSGAIQPVGKRRITSLAGPAGKGYRILFVGRASFPHCTASTPVITPPRVAPSKKWDLSAA